MRKHLEIDKHKGDCLDIFNVRRLYIKGYNDKGEQRFVSYGLTCTSCDSFIRENYDPKLKPKAVRIMDEEHTDEIIKKKGS